MTEIDVAAATFAEVDDALRGRGGVVEHPSTDLRRFQLVISAPCPVCGGAKMTVGSSNELAGIKCNARECDPDAILTALGIGHRHADDAAIEAAVHSGQVRKALRLAASYANKLKYVNGIGWHYYDATRWAYDDCGRAPRAVLAVLQTALGESVGDGIDKSLRKDVAKCESATGVRGVLEIASALPEFAVTVRDLDADSYQVNTATGTVDLRTADAPTPHRPGDLISKVTRAAYDPYPMGSTWARFLNEVLPDEEVLAYLQRLVGVALIGRVVEHVLAILIGVGANGKSTFVKAVCWALGDYASTAEPDLMMQRQGAHPTGETDLLGKRLIVVNESENGRKLDPAKMKRLTGGDTIRARRMRQDFFEFEPSHTTLLVTNHLPMVAGDDPAIWRRLRVIPFDVEIPPEDRDPHLDEALQLEADVILAWALHGLRDYRRRGGLDEPAAVLVATGDYQKASDAVARFVLECCTTTSEVQQVGARALFVEWDRWRTLDGAEQISEKAFGQSMDRLGHPARKFKSGGMRQGIQIVTKVER
jgi:putative DNA primase/helicase